MADTSTEIAKIDADPAGDLVLVIGSGDDQRSIRASSKVLGLASPVLAAMFSPGRFLEGTALSSSNPPEIHLPEDDPEAVTMFCHIVHFREYRGKQPGPSSNQLVNMALFCDKYNVGLALNPWSELWLQRQLTFETPKLYGNLVALAYAFDNQEGFWISSRSMMQYNMADHPHGTSHKLLPLLPKGFYASIDEDRKAALLDLSSMVDHTVAHFFQENARNNSLYDNVKAGYVLGELYRLTIWPISTRVNEINLGYIEKQIANFKEQDSPVNTWFKRELTNVITRAIDAQKGLCLCCVRKGKTSIHQGNCHARLRYLCTG